MDYIKQKLSLLPMQPGCYLMKDGEGTVIYVGKAKKLKNRVSSYFNGVHNYKTTRLVSEIVDFDYIVTASEKEALLLEINLIKDYAPRYNIMFMDNSYYPYIQLTRERHPRLRIVRNAADKNCKHFGPFPDATAARDTFRLLNRLYPLRKCEHMPKKPCLYASLGQCLAPCVNEVPESEYKKIASDISRFIHGDTRDVISELEARMEKESAAMNYEVAMECRDLINHINHVTARQHVQFDDGVDRDILGYEVDKGYLSIQLFFMRQGKLLSRDFNIMPVYDEEEDEIVRFIMDFYSVNTCPKELLVPAALDDQLLNEILDCKVIKPQKGNKADLVKMACDNAREMLENKFSMMEKTETNTIGAVRQLGELLHIATPHRIELFDNSNLQGAYAVAGMVVYVDGVPSKNDYRKFKIRTVDGPDDYASMKEIIYRRYFRVLTEHLTPPDLIIVDGGKGQIKAAREALNSLRLSYPVCGLSKDDRHQTSLLIDQNGDVIDVDRRSALFYLLTRMQDEVHRYAISFHRNLRAKSLADSVLDDIPGIGAKRKKQLLNHFGSVKRLRQADEKALGEVVGPKLAAVVYDHLHSDSG